MNLIAVSIGNTRTRIGIFAGEGPLGELESTSVISSDEPEAIANAVLEAQAPGETPVVMATVRPDVAQSVMEALIRDGRDVYRFGRGGRELTVPIQRALEDDLTVGQDRLLSALGAWSRAQQATIIIDAGTAVTVDFVDGQGIFQGGAIAPGLNMMLAALHEKTAALPEVRYEPVGDDRPFGKSTMEAMRLGVQACVKGMTRHLAERYSEVYGAYPQIVATGGDARILFEDDDLVEAIVPDLTLIGIHAACLQQLAGEEGEDEDEDL